MGVGHVPEEPVHSEREGPQFQGRQRRGTPEGRPARRSPRLAARARGAWGEDLVARWYQRNGYEIVARNWRIRDGELDIVARKGRLIVVCEVKTRSSTAYGTPAESISERKQFVVRRTAHHFLREFVREFARADRSRSWSLRIDVACVVGANVEMIFDAF